MPDHKKELINELAQALKSYGYTVYIAKRGDYGFYTDGQRVVSFGATLNYSLDYAGNYRTDTSNTTGTGWCIARDLSVIDEETAKQFIKAVAPSWATRGAKVHYTTPEQYLKTYGQSSAYIEF